MTRPDYTEPWEWSAHYYGLIEEGMRQTDCLAVCVAHQGRHPFVNDACHELPKPLSKRERAQIANQDRTPAPADPEPWRVDRESMVAALVEAGELMLARRRAERAAGAQNGYQTRTAPPAAPGGRNDDSGPSGAGAPHRVSPD